MIVIGDRTRTVRPHRRPVPRRTRTGRPAARSAARQDQGHRRRRADGRRLAGADRRHRGPDPIDRQDLRREPAGELRERRRRRSPRKKRKRVLVVDDSLTVREAGAQAAQQPWLRRRSRGRRHGRLERRAHRRLQPGRHRHRHAAHGRHRTGHADQQGPEPEIDAGHDRVLQGSRRGSSARPRGRRRPLSDQGQLPRRDARAGRRRSDRRGRRDDARRDRRVGRRSGRPRDVARRSAEGFPGRDRHRPARRRAHGAGDGRLARRSSRACRCASPRKAIGR